jgi:hypothetical protein
MHLNVDGEISSLPRDETDDSNPRCSIVNLVSKANVYNSKAIMDYLIKLSDVRVSELILFIIKLQEILDTAMKDDDSV